MPADRGAAAIAAINLGVANVTLKYGVLPFVVAAIVSATLGGIEQHSRLHSRFTLKNGAWIWWGLRLLLEIGVGIVAMVIIRHADPKAANNPLAWIAAGAAGPAVMRLRVLDLDRRPIGIATAYEPVRGLLEDQIDRRTAECLATWINYKMLPRFGRLRVTPAELTAYAIDFVKGRYRVSSRELQYEIEWLDRARDGNQPDEVKIDLIVRHVALELGGYRLLERYLSEREGKT